MRASEYTPIKRHVFIRNRTVDICDFLHLHNKPAKKKAKADNLILDDTMKENQTMMNLSTMAKNVLCPLQGRKCQYGPRLTSRRTRLGTSAECDGQ